MENLTQQEIIFRAVISVIFAAITVAIYIFVRGMNRRYLKQHNTTGEKATAARVTFSIIEFAVLILGIIAIMQANGINISAVAAGLGIAGIIVGLALQDYLKDIIMGLHILVDRFFIIGDCVEYEGREGEITEMNLKTTTIVDLEDASVMTVCNRNITQIRRLSRRMDIDVPIPYEEDAERVGQTMQNICQIISTIENVGACSYKGIQSFESSSVLYRIRLDCNPVNRSDVRRAALQTVFSELNKVGIHIPFNQLDVHLDGEK